MTKPKMILIGVILLFLILVTWYIIGCPPLKKCPGSVPQIKDRPEITLSFVGSFDTQRDWEEIFAKFRSYKKLEENGFLDVTIKYKTLSGNYQNEVKELQYDGKGPNIFMLFNSWLPEYKDDLLPAPKEMMTLAQYKNTFAKVTVDDFTTSDGKIYSFPLYVDTLALFYNEDMFLQAGYTKPPENWDEFKNYVEKLRRFKEEETNVAAGINNTNINQLEIAGAAFGGGWNVNRSQDILMLLVIQNNLNKNEENPLSFTNKGSRDAIKYYTSFTDPSKRFYTWDKNWMYSIDAFTQNKAAMMINYTRMLKNIKEKTQGEVNFRIAPIPQLDKNNKVNYAEYWSPVVPAKAPCKTEENINCYSLAWEFLNFAAKEENAKLYLDKTNKPSAILQLAEKQRDKNDGVRSIFANQVLTAKSWKHPNSTQSDTVLIQMIDFLTTENLDTGEETIDEIIESYGNKIKALQ